MALVVRRDIWGLLILIPSPLGTPTPPASTFLPETTFSQLELSSAATIFGRVLLLNSEASLYGSTHRSFHSQTAQVETGSCS